MDKTNKNEVIRALQKFIKHSINYKADPDFNMAREYCGERYAVLEGRDFKNPRRLSGTIHFVDTMEHADSILHFNVSFYQIVVDIRSMQIIKENFRQREPFDRWWENEKVSNM